MRGYEIADEKSHKFYNRQIKKLHERMLQMIHPLQKHRKPHHHCQRKKTGACQS